MSSDSVQLCLSRKTGEMLQRLRANRPLVHCITNEVVQEITADVLLAAGASPAMVVGEGEAEYFAGIASALSVNVGTPYEARIETMKKAIRGALAAGKPWVLDPVAAGGMKGMTWILSNIKYSINFGEMPDEYVDKTTCLCKIYSINRARIYGLLPSRALRFHFIYARTCPAAA